MCSHACACFGKPCCQLSVMHSPQVPKLFLGGESTCKVGPETQRLVLGCAQLIGEPALRAVGGVCKRVSRPAGVLEIQQTSCIFRLVAVAVVQAVMLKTVSLFSSSIRSVMQKYLAERNEITFDKIFNQKIGKSCLFI